MPDDLQDLEEKLRQFRAGEKSETENEQSRQRESRDMNTGMRAGSEFMSYVLAGGLVGYGAGRLFGGMPFWIILMVFTGFAMGAWRAYKVSNQKD
jgi:ATP synthase protein I